MNLKKHIKLKEELTEQPQLTEEDIARRNALFKAVQQTAADCKPSKKRINLWKIFAPIATAAVALVVTLTCIFTPKIPAEKTYNDNDIISIKATYAEMIEDFQYFELNQLEKVEDLLLSYDSVSNDKLFYTLNATAVLSKINLIVVINKNYNYNFGVTEEIADKELTDYTVTYCSETNRGEAVTNYKGWIKVETETVYFDMLIPSLGDEAFFETIQQIIQVKK